jgi:hypothetical protein
MCCIYIHKYYIYTYRLYTLMYSMGLELCFFFTMCSRNMLDTEWLFRRDQFTCSNVRAA